MSTIGTLTVVLTANSAEFANGMDKAAGHLSKFQKSAAGKSIIKGLGLSPADVTAISTGVLAAAAVIGAMAKVANVAGEALGRAAEEVAKWVAEGTAAIDTAYKLAGALGITTDSFMGLATGAQFAADMGAVEFGELLKKMSKAVAEGDSGLQKLGLSAKNLSTMSADKQFLAVADALSRIKNPAEQMRAAMDIFGKGATLQFLNWIKDGAASLEAAQRKAVEYGTAVSQIDAAKVAAMKDQVEQLQMRWQGVKNTVAVALAPSIIVVAEAIQRTLPPANALKVIIRDWIFLAAAFGDALSDIIDNSKRFLSIVTLIKNINTPWANHTDLMDAAKEIDALSVAMDRANAGKKNVLPAIDNDAVTRIASMRDAINAMKLEAMTAGMSDADKKLTEFIMKFRPGAKDIQEFGAALQRVSQVTEQMAKKAEQLEKQKSIASFIENLRKQAQSFGLEGWDKVLFDLKEMGATAPDLMKAMHWQAVLDAAKEHKKIMDEIDQAWKDNMTPIEKYVSALEHIAMLQREGLNAEVAKRLVIKANQELLNSYRSNDPGIVEARQVRFSIAPPVARRVDPLERIANILQQEKATQDRQLQEARETNKLLQEQGFDVVEIGA